MYNPIPKNAALMMRETGMDFADAFAQVKAELGAESRKSKATIILGDEEQLANWRAQMTPQERESLETVSVKNGKTQDLLDRHAAESIAISHLFERSSVARELHAAAVLLRREMRQLVSFTAGNDCRVISSGDSRQHHSVERGDALRILEKSAVVASAALTRIFRQQVPALRAAIEDLSQGKTEEGFDKLDKFGVIREIEKADERISLPSRVDCAVGR